MGITKEHYCDELERSQMAKILEISEEDLLKVNWEIVESRSDDGLVYCYFCYFSDDSDADVLDKIGVDNERKIELPSGIFEDQPEDQEEL